MTGPSGSGKTTLLTLICGLRSAQEGSLQVLAKEVCGASQSQLTQFRRDIGYIFQSHNLHQSLTAQQNVEMALQLHQLTARERQARAVDMLTSVGLENRRNYFPDDLSGGQNNGSRSPAP